MEDKIVYAYVVADILHIGHILALENAKALGDKLVVGVLTDEAVMEKKKKPVFSLGERIKIIKSLRCVDLAIPQPTYSPTENIIKVKPHIVVESDSHNEKDIKYTEKIAKKIGARVFVMPYFPEQSSTKIKMEIKK